MDVVRCRLCDRMSSEPCIYCFCPCGAKLATRKGYLLCSKTPTSNVRRKGHFGRLGMLKQDHTWVSYL
jgi:hypothetical protein